MVVPSVVVFCVIIIRHISPDTEMSGTGYMPPRDIPSISLSTNEAKGKYLLVNQRPLFVSSRRPPPVADNATFIKDMPSVPSSQFLLLGTMIIGNERRAVLKSLGTSDVVTLGPGQSIDGNVLDEIDIDHVIIRSGHTKSVLSLMDAKK